MTTPFTRFAGMAGVAFAVLLLAVNAAIGASGKPMGGAELADVAAWFVDHPGVVRLTSVVAPLIWLTLPLFAVGILRFTSTTSFNPWAVLGLVAVAMQNAVFSVVIATDTILAVRADTLLATPGSSLALWDLHNAFFTLNGASIALALGGFSAATLVSRRVAPWFGIAGMVGAALFLANALQLPAVLVGTELPFGIAAGVLWLLWAAAMAATMVRARPS